MEKAEKQNISAEGSVSVGVLHSEGGFVFDEKYFFDPEYRWQQDLQIAQWCEEKYSPYPIYNAEAQLVQLEHQPLPYRQVGGLQPNLILGAALGADLILPGNLDPDITQHPLQGIKDISTLKNICWEAQKPVNIFLEQLDSLKHKYKETAVDIFPPYFWDRSGRATIHGPLTTALKLMGEDFFILPFTDSEFASEFVMWIARAYNQLIQLFAEKAELSVTGIHIGECSGSLFSAELWESLAVPAMNELAEKNGSVRIHSCGKSDHLLEQMTQVHNVDVINIGSDTSIDRCRKLVGEQVKIEVIPDVQLLNDGSTENIEAWVKKCLDENNGGPLKIQFHLDSGIPFENIVAIFQALQSSGLAFSYESLVDRWNQ